MLVNNPTWMDETRRFNKYFDLLEDIVTPENMNNWVVQLNTEQGGGDFQYPYEGGDEDMMHQDHEYHEDTGIASARGVHHDDPMTIQGGSMYHKTTMKIRYRNAMYTLYTHPHHKNNKYILYQNRFRRVPAALLGNIKLF